MEVLKKQNRLVLNEKGSAAVEFTLIFGVVLIIAVLMTGFALDQISTPEGMKEGAKLAGIALVISLAIFFVFRKLASFMGDGPLLSSGNKEAEILKDMFKKAHGFRTAKRFDPSEKLYNQIIRNYPDELNAPFYLGDLLWKELGQSKKALRKFTELEKRIQQDSLKFEFRAILKRNIENIKEELKGS